MGKTSLTGKGLEGESALESSTAEELASPNTPSSASSAGSEPSESCERRRSERVKREKPDYYDALDFDTGRRQKSAANNATPTRPRREAATKTSFSKIRAKKDHKSSSRATLTWKKGKSNEDEDDDKSGTRRRKRAREREEELHMMDEVAPEKALQCRVGLAEINRKLPLVMTQPK